MGLQYVAKLSGKFGMQHYVVTADQVIYNIAYGLRNGAPPGDNKYDNLNLMLSTFHMAGNVIAAIGKIMRSSGGEAILASASVCKPGAANKVFGPSVDYYQSMRPHTVLREAMATLHFEAFEDWCNVGNAESQLFTQLSKDLEVTTQKLKEGESIHDQMAGFDSLHQLQDLLEEFTSQANAYPTQRYWTNYIHMIDILLRFTAAQHLAMWEYSLQEDDNICCLTLWQQGTTTTTTAIHFHCSCVK